MGLYILIALGGAFAGFVGTLAGLASVLTLYILLEIGLEGDIANGTIRVGIMAMALMALPTFHRAGHLDFNKSWPIIISIFIGSLGGFILAINVDNHTFIEIFKYLLFVMLVLVLTNSKKWTQKTDRSHKMNYWLTIPVFLAMGFYAGFIQVGTGMFLVVFLAVVGKYSLMDANAVKLSAFALYTFVGIVIFALNDKIDWGLGVTLAIGQGIGAYIAARFGTTYPNANSFIRYLLIVVLVIAIIRMFEWYKYLLP